jgi:hypothetical protein
MHTNPVILTIISEKELPLPPRPLNLFRAPFFTDPRVSYLEKFDAINSKFGAYDRGFGKVIDQAGCDRHAWEFLEMDSLTSAESLAKAMAAKCTQHKIKAFNANAEAGWAGTTPFPPYGNPYHVMKRFVEVFRLHAPTYTELWYNGFTWGRTAAGVLLHDAPLISLFDVWCPMNYGTDTWTLNKFWNDKCFKYRTRIPNLRVVPMTGCGRVAADGKVWGFWPTQRKLLTTTPVNGWSIFFGNGAKNQMLVGNPKHASLVSCVQDLRDDPQWEE